MKFSSIIRKNFIHNFNKYISFYFVNSLIVAMLFMYGSLMFNNTVIEGVGKTSISETIQIALMGIIVFSMVFITYTNRAFLKNRGKEFGMYLTLGMTTKNLNKLILIENLGIMIASVITGILSGALFGKLFYLGLNKILDVDPIPYEINYKTFLLSIGVFVGIFLCNLIFNMFYIKRVSIVEAIKSSKKKEVGKANLLMGGISLILLVLSMYCLPKALLNEMFKDQAYMKGVFIVLIIICPYMVIGSAIALLKALLSKLPKVYNRNILVLSNISHRFVAYKNTLYMLSILLAGAIYFVGFSYAMYASTREYVEKDNPYDIMFIETNEYNKVSMKEVKEVINNNTGRVDNYKVLEYIEIPEFRYENESIRYWSDKSTVISESNYNKHMDTSIELSPEESLYVTIENERIKNPRSSTFFIPLDEKEIDKIASLSREHDFLLPVEEFKNSIGNTEATVLNKKNISEIKNVPIANYRYGGDYSTGSGYIIDDNIYNELKEKVSNSSLKKIHLINGENGKKVILGLNEYLREVNNLDNSYWKQGNEFGGLLSSDERGVKETYRPIYKEELVSLKLNSNGMVFFTIIFIGMLFVIANGVVLYYKVLSDINDEHDRRTSLNRIGIRDKEMKSIISKELAIIFFVPIIVGGGIGMYYLYIMTSNGGMTESFMSKTFIVLTIMVIIQTIFYLISRKKYIKEVIK